MLSAGQYFAGYRIIRLIGTGGMGEVYLAAHPRLPREDALKLLPAELTNDPVYRKRFTREAELAASMDHPNIVSVYDRGEDQGQLWLSMKYVPGADADELLKQHGPFSPTDTAEVITAIGDALDYGFGKGLLHRDVKPANIVVDSTETTRRKVYLTDFGIARTVGNESRITAANLTVGSIQYTSPEQLSGADDLDGRSDQYSLACTAFKLLTGRPPYVSSSTSELINAHLLKPVPSVSQFRPELPAAVDAVLDRAMSKERSARYPSSSDFARDLSAALRGEQPSGVTPPPAGTGSPVYQPTMIAPGTAVPPGPSVPGPAAPTTPYQAGPTVPLGGQAPGQPPAAPASTTPFGAGQSPYPVPPNPYQHQDPYPQQNPYQQAAYGSGSQAAYGSGSQAAYGSGSQAAYGGGGGQPPYGLAGTGAPGGGPDKKKNGLIAGAIIGVLALVAAIVTVVVLTGGGDEKKTAGGDPSSATSPTTFSYPSTTTGTTTTEAPREVPVAGGVPTRCVDGTSTRGGSVSAGLRSGVMAIPSADLPTTGWTADSGSRIPFVTDAASISASRPEGATSWASQIIVGTLPANFTGTTAAIGRKFLECIVESPGFSGVQARPTDITGEDPGSLEDSNVTLTIFQANIRIGADRGVPGDDLFLVVVDTNPKVIALGISPIGDAVTKGEVEKAVKALRVNTEE